MGAAEIRTERLVTALTRRTHRVHLITAGETAVTEPEQDRLTTSRFTPDGKVPPEWAHEQAAPWPTEMGLPGPDADEAAVAAIRQIATGLLKRGRVKLIIATGPPFSILAAGLTLARQFDIPLLIDFRDAWFSHMPWPYRHRRARTAARYWEAACLREAHGVITATQTLRTLLIDTYGKDLAEKSITVRHGYAPCDNTATPPKNDTETLNLAYVGQLRGVREAAEPPLPKLWRTVNQTLRRMLLGARFCEGLQLEWMSPHFLMQAMARAGEKEPTFKQTVHLHILGETFPEVNQWAQRWGLTDQIHQRSWVPAEQAQRFVEQMDVMVLSLYGIVAGGYHWCVPSKLYNYMGATKPTLALTPPGEAADLVKQAGIGFVTPPDDVPAITNTLLQLFAQHRRSGIEIAPNQTFIQQFAAERQQTIFSKFVKERIVSEE